MKLKLAVAGVAAALMIAALPLWAHHSFSAEYDQSKPITIKGKFTHMDWINPHSWVHIDVVGEDGKTTNWAGETPPPNGLYRNGWRKDTLKAGETIEISGFAAKDGSPHMWASTVRLLDRPQVAGRGGKMEPPTMGFGSRPPSEGPQGK
jgi:hypothetical protein